VTETIAMIAAIDGRHDRRFKRERDRVRLGTTGYD
jgi:hypothetical protein